jgi:hypothetical protein
MLSTAMLGETKAQHDHYFCNDFTMNITGSAGTSSLRLPGAVAMISLLGGLGFLRQDVAKY